MQINNQTEYELALKRIDTLVDDYEVNRTEIVALAEAIAIWEDTSPEFDEFNADLKRLSRLSEKQLLDGLNADNAHVDELAKLSDEELKKF